jgi:short-subunit dehydrogenase
MVHKIVFIGASSELAQSLVPLIGSNADLICVSTKPLASSLISRNIILKDYSATSISDFVSSLDRRSLHVFVFFNGVSDSCLFINSDETELLEIFSVNFFIPATFVRIALKRLVPSKNKYIFLSSARAFQGDRGVATYSASKSALKYFAKCLSLEYGPFNQFFYVLSLGLFEAGLAKKVNPKRLETLLANSAKKGFVAPSALLSGINFAIDNDSATGSVISVDNGYF